MLPNETHQKQSLETVKLDGCDALARPWLCARKKHAWQTSIYGRVLYNRLKFAIQIRF